MDASDEKLAIAAAKLRLALDLHEDRLSLMRQNFIRRHPGESEVGDRCAIPVLAPGSTHGRAWTCDDLG